MHRSRGHRALLSVLFLTAFLASAPRPAVASCVMPPPLGQAVEDADIAFVGTVINTVNQDRWATVSVEEVWKGNALPARVEVRGGPPDPPGDLVTMTSVDRSFVRGRRYLFLPHKRAGGPAPVFHDNICSRTTKFGERVEALRPASARDRGPRERESNDMTALVLAVIAGVAVGGAIAVFGRRGLDGRRARRP